MPRCVSDMNTRQNRSASPHKYCSVAKWVKNQERQPWHWFQEQVLAPTLGLPQHISVSLRALKQMPSQQSSMAKDVYSNHTITETCCANARECDFGHTPIAKNNLYNAKTCATKNFSQFVCTLQAKRPFLFSKRLHAAAPGESIANALAARLKHNLLENRKTCFFWSNSLDQIFRSLRL